MAKTSKPKPKPSAQVPLHLSRGAARFLHLFLDAHNRVPIFDSVEQVFHAGLLLQGPLASVGKLPPDVAADADHLFEPWAREPFEEFAISKGQRETVRHGLDALAKKGALQVHRYTIELLQAFGMEP